LFQKKALKERKLIVTKINICKIKEGKCSVKDSYQSEKIKGFKKVNKFVGISSCFWDIFKVGLIQNVENRESVIYG